jgi:hypothetical protein
MDRDALIRAYAEGPDVVAAALTPLTDDQLDRRPAPGEWTAREVVHHLADSETMSTIRLRRLLAEDDPVIEGYDEAEWARRLPYDRPIDASLAVLRAVRAANVEVLGALDDDGWGRSGTHTESGPYSVTTWLEIYAAHAHDHAAQITTAATS